MKTNDRQLVPPEDLDKIYKPKPPLTVAARVYAGPGIGLAEIQTVIEPPPQTGRGKILAVGVPRVEIEQVVSSILHIPGLSGRPDYSITCRLIGADKYIPSFGLAACVSVIASYFKRPIPPTSIFLGEIDLQKRIRGGTGRLIENLRRSIDAEEVGTDLTLFAPSTLATDHLSDAPIKVASCRSLMDVITAMWPTGNSRS